jgi:predicted nucleic acid-binding protein
VSYLIDSDWLIDAFIGVPAAVNLLAQLRTEGLAVSIISYGELFEGAIGAAEPQAELVQFRTFQSD